MRCSCCGQSFTDITERCPRCGADQTATAKRRRVLITLVYATVAILLVMLLIFVVLYWHETQMGM